MQYWQINIGGLETTDSNVRKMKVKLGEKTPKMTVNCTSGKIHFSQVNPKNKQSDYGRVQ